jgi:hypothetical protein
MSWEGSGLLRVIPGLEGESAALLYFMLAQRHPINIDIEGNPLSHSRRSIFGSI